MKATKNECPYLCFYKSYLEMLEPYTFEERGRLITAMMEYMYTGATKRLVGNERFVWNMLKFNIDRDKETYIAKCETNRKNAKKRNAAKASSADDSDGLPPQSDAANKKKKENKKENKKNKNNKKEKESENIMAMPEAEAAFTAATAPADMTPSPYEIPDVDSILSFCQEEGIYVDPYRFIERYDTVGWQLGGQPIYDWRPLVKKWARTEEDPEIRNLSPMALIEKYKRQQASAK